MSFHKENWKDESLILIYDMTLGELWSLEGFLKKFIQLGWFGTLTNLSPFLFEELGMEQMKDYNGS